MISYRQFRSLVNQELVSRCGMGLECLADCDISDYWDAELSDDDARALAIEAALDVLMENDFPMDTLSVKP